MGYFAHFDDAAAAQKKAQDFLDAESSLARGLDSAAGEAGSGYREAHG